MEKQFRWLALGFYILDLIVNSGLRLWLNYVYPNGSFFRSIMSNLSGFVINCSFKSTLRGRPNHYQLNGLTLHEYSVAQWIECLPYVREVMGSIPVGDSVFFLFHRLCHVDQLTFHMIIPMGQQPLHLFFRTETWQNMLSNISPEK